MYQGATYTTPYLTQCFNADGNLVNIVGLIRTYGIGLIAGPIVGFIATKIKSPSKTILGGFILSIAVLVGFILFPQDPSGAMVRLHHLRRLLHRLLAAVRGQDPHGHLRHRLRPAVRHRLPA